MRNYLVVTLILFFLIAPTFAIAESSSEISRLTSIELADAYTHDKDAAEAKYTDKIIELTGIVKESYTMNLPTMPHVKLEGNEMGSVLCYFDGQEDLLEKDSAVVIRGKCEGALLGTPKLVDCEIIKR